MLQLFLKNHFLRSLLLLPLALALQVPGFIMEPVPMDLHTGFLSDNVAAFAVSHPFGIRVLLAFIIFLNAVLLNRIIIINRMSLSISLYPGAIYVALASIIPAFGDLTILPLANTFFILMLGQIFYAHKKYGISDKIFTTGLYCGLLSVLYPPAIFYLVLCYISILILRALRLKENLNLLNGLLIPFYILSVYFIWIGEGGALAHIFFGDTFGIMKIPDYSTLEGIVSTSILVVLPFIAFLRYRTYVMKKSIQVRKKIDILFWSMLITVAFLLFHDHWHLQYGLFLVPALSFLFAESLMRIKNNVLSELLFSIILIWALISNFVL